MSNSTAPFRKWLGSLSALGIVVLAILNSPGLTEVQKYFAGTLLLIALVLVYAELTFQKKKGVKDGGPQGGEGNDE